MTNRNEHVHFPADASQGIDPSELARMWIKKHIEKESTREAKTS
jgi:hypothetical protein